MVRNDAGDPLQFVYDDHIEAWTLSYANDTLKSAEVDSDSDGTVDVEIDFDGSDESTTATRTSAEASSEEEWGRYEGVLTFQELRGQPSYRLDHVLEERFVTQVLSDVDIDGVRDSRTVYSNDGLGFHISSETRDADDVLVNASTYGYDCD